MGQQEWETCVVESQIQHSRLKGSVGAERSKVVQLPIENNSISTSTYLLIDGRCTQGSTKQQRNGLVAFDLSAALCAAVQPFLPRIRFPPLLVCCLQKLVDTLYRNRKG